MEALAAKVLLQPAVATLLLAGRDYVEVRSIVRDLAARAQVEARFGETPLLVQLNTLWALTQLRVTHHRLLEATAGDLRTPNKVAQGRAHGKIQSRNDENC